MAEEGELLKFWNDPGDVRYRESYFYRWPGA
jgi:hypothetical protein